MNKIHISQNQFSDLINLVNGVFLPINNFVSKKEFIQIIDNQKYKNHFFPFPITFGVNK
jgi:ATP sulfurylase